ncbi:hypothetical protein [Thiomonas delicata]|uniref:hypothetical protein n=1 Tax=Thiomonas delicata TaxID=364030 RepID=UPI001FE2825D|nr:hypothetical protein [Thiomonas delicata]
MAWLLEDAERRGHNAVKLAQELCVSNQDMRLLDRGQAPELLRDHAFIAKAARYLGIPPVTVRLLVGDITIRDFATRTEPEDVVIEREFARFMANPQLRALVANDDAELTLDYKRLLLDIHGQHRHLDWPEAPRLPEILRWLQRAAIVHDGNEGEAVRAMR